MNIEGLSLSSINPSYIKRQTVCESVSRDLIVTFSITFQKPARKTVASYVKYCYNIPCSLFSKVKD